MTLSFSPAAEPASCLSVIWPLLEAELGHLKARAIFAAAGLSMTGIEDGLVEQPKPKQRPNLRVSKKGESHGDN